MASLSPHYLRVALLPTERRQELRLRPWMTFPQMTQVLKAVGLESGLMSDPEPVLLTTLHPHSSMKKDLDFPTGPWGQNDDWHVWNTGRGKSPSICWDTLITRAVILLEQLPGWVGSVYGWHHRGTTSGEGGPGGLKPFQLNCCAGSKAKVAGLPPQGNRWQPASHTCCGPNTHTWALAASQTERSVASLLLAPKLLKQKML